MRARYQDAVAGLLAATVSLGFLVAPTMGRAESFADVVTRFEADNVHVIFSPDTIDPGLDLAIADPSRPPTSTEFARALAHHRLTVRVLTRQEWLIVPGASDAVITVVVTTHQGHPIADFPDA